MGTGIVVHRLREADLPAYRAMMLGAYPRYPDAFTATAEERAALPLSWWAQRTGVDEAADQYVFGAFDAGRLVGAVGLSFEPRPKTRHKANLFGMYVHESARGRGVGQQLIDAALEFARSRTHVILVRLEVTEGNLPALRLYERMGFRPYGVEPHAVAASDGYRGKILMWIGLRAPAMAD